MAGKGAVLALRIISDASGAARGFQEADSQVNKFQGGLDRASIAAAGTLAAVGAIAQEAYAAASAAQQSAGAVESVFGAEAEAIKGLAAEAAQAVGLSTNSYQELASVLGAQLAGMGYAGAELTAQTDSLIGTGADLAATFGGTTADAVSALSSLMRGERDPIERYGIALNQAAVDARVAALGLDTSTPAAQRAAEAQATLAIVAEQSAAAQGAFAREADTAAGQTQRASAEFENAKAALGDVLLPIVASAAQQLAGLAQTLVENKDVVIPLVAVVSGLAAAILLVNGAIKAYRTVAMIATAAQWLFNVAMSANPIGLVVLAVAALVAGVVYAYNKFEGFRNVVKSVWEWLKKAFDFAKNIGGALADKLFGGPAQLVVASARGGGGAAAGTYGAAGGAPAAVAAPSGLYGAPMTALADGRSTVGQSPAGNVTVQVDVGVGDPVAIGRELERILRKYAAATGSDVALQVGTRR
jgi:hypothetical protein